MSPRISIISINFNNASGLQKTMESVFQQHVKPDEFIVVDGGSTDGSAELIKAHAEKLSWWISERDKGIYEAQNKGLAKSTGDYVLFLNSGDELLDAGTLEKVRPFLDGTEIVYGDLLICETSRTWVKKYNEPISFGYFLEDTLPHQGSFIKKTVFDKTGKFDESLRICSDWKFFVEAICRHNVRIRYLDFATTRFDYTGVSSNPESQKRMADEKETVLQKEFPRFIKEYRELFTLRSKYPLLANSRVVKAYFKIRKLFIRDK